MSTYLQLVNKTTLLSGTHLDPLDSVTWANPSQDRMIDRYKEYVAEAYKTIQMERGEWEFLAKQATLILSPRIVVTNGNRPTAPAAGEIYEGAETEAQLEVIGTELISGAWLDGDATAIIEYINLDKGFKLNEPFDEIDPDPLNTDSFSIKDWGRYNLQEIIPDLFEVDHNSFYLQSTGGSTVQDNDGSVGIIHVPFVNYALWKYGQYDSGWGASRPVLLTISDDGHLEFYPRLQEQFVVKFNYTANPSLLADFDDEVVGIPEAYQDVIVYRALMWAAEFNKQYDAMQRYESKYKWYMQRLESNQLTEPTFGPSRYNSVGWRW